MSATTNMQELLKSARNTVLSIEIGIGEDIPRLMLAVVMLHISQLCLCHQMNLLLPLLNPCAIWTVDFSAKRSLWLIVRLFLVTNYTCSFDMFCDSHKPPVSRFRAFTTSLGIKDSTSPSPRDQPSFRQRPVSVSSTQSLYGNFTLFLRVHSARNLPTLSQSSYCKIYLGDTPIIGGFGQGKSLVGAEGSSHRSFHTKVQSSSTRNCPEWNEKFQLNVRDLSTEVLTIRVKHHILFYSPAIGACVIHMWQLRLGETLDKWFPLSKNDESSGQIRLQVCLQETSQTPTLGSRHSQASKATIQRLLLKHRELEDANRRELVLQQQEKWKRMEEDTVDHVGKQEPMERWREQGANRVQQKQQTYFDHLDVLPSFKNRDVMAVEITESDSLSGSKNRGVKMMDNSNFDRPPSFKDRNVKKEEAIATQLMKNLKLQVDLEENKKSAVNLDISACYVANVQNQEADYRGTDFGMIQLSAELDRVVQSALPISERSSSTSSEYEGRRRPHGIEKCSYRKKRSKRLTSRENETSDASSTSVGDCSKGTSQIVASKEDIFDRKPTRGSASTRSESVNQKDSDIPTTLTFPPGSSDESSEDERRRWCRHSAQKSKSRNKERKHQYQRARSRHNYESSYSSSSLSSSSSFLSSSEEERLERKLKKKKKAKAARACAIRASDDSRASAHIPGMQYSHNRTGQPGR